MEKTPRFDALHKHTVVLPPKFRWRKPQTMACLRCQNGIQKEMRRQEEERQKEEVKSSELSNWMILLFDKKGVSKLLVIPSPTIVLLLGYNINYLIARLWYWGKSRVIKNGVPNSTNGRLPLQSGCQSHCWPHGFLRISHWVVKLYIYIYIYLCVYIYNKKTGYVTCTPFFHLCMYHLVAHGS